MSELSPVYSEYEKISNLFRSLNEATLVARQAKLGLKTPSPQRIEVLRKHLKNALEQLGSESPGKSESAFSAIIAQLTNRELLINPSTLLKISHRIKNSLLALTDDDLEIIEQITDALDSKSELLFRRIQK